MKLKIILLLIVAWVLSVKTVLAQIDSVIVEKYYISDDNDATDITGGGLLKGSVTYRIFVDLAAGSKLMRVFGDAAHTFKISSTEVFFNHEDRGKSFGKEISSTRLNQGTLALDTWLTLSHASNIHMGVLKKEDTDGSMVGGRNNDGGSANIPGGLLVNTNPAAGIALTTSDGLLLVPTGSLPTNVTAQINGINLSSSTDTTIFGSLKSGRKFFSNNFTLSGTVIPGTTSDNRVLIAQVTTRGQLSFELNLEIEQKDGLYTKRVKYVARDPRTDEIKNRYLTYPPLPPPCGCKNPDYAEFNKALECHAQDSCKTPIVYGCTDPNACNYNPGANYNIPGMCCYPGRCNGRDINTVCPGLKGVELGFTIYPNPAQEYVSVDIVKGKDQEIQCLIYDSKGNILLREGLGSISDKSVHTINISELSKGLYFLRIIGDDRSVTKTFIKN